MRTEGGGREGGKEDDTSRVCHLRSRLVAIKHYHTRRYGPGIVSSFLGTRRGKKSADRIEQYPL